MTSFIKKLAVSVIFVVIFLTIIQFCTKVKVPIVTTLRVNDITQTSSVSGGNVIDDGGDEISSRGVCWGKGFNPTIDDDTTINGSGKGSFTSNLTGLDIFTSYNVRAYAINSAGVGYGSSIYFETHKPLESIVFNPDLLYGSVSDIEGNIYKTIQIGTQTWMAENLRTGRFSDNSIIPLIKDSTAWMDRITPGYCWFSNDSSTYKEIFGGLYNWYAVVDNRNLCPTGWHIPSGIEWNNLRNYYDGFYYAGGKLKESGTAHWGNPNNGATNESGFTALPGGMRFGWGAPSMNTPQFTYSGSFGFWWSSTEYQNLTDKGIVLWLDYSSPYAEGGSEYKNCGLSVRCIKD